MNSLSMSCQAKIFEALGSLSGSCRDKKGGLHHPERACSKWAHAYSECKGVVRFDVPAFTA